VTKPAPAKTSTTEATTTTTSAPAPTVIKIESADPQVFMFPPITPIRFTGPGQTPPIRPPISRPRPGAVWQQLRQRLRLQPGRRHNLCHLQQHRLG
jgi:hypothetical protein